MKKTEGLKALVINSGFKTGRIGASHSSPISRHVAQEEVLGTIHDPIGEGGGRQPTNAITEGSTGS